MKKKETNASSNLERELAQEKAADQRHVDPKRRGSGDGGPMRVYDEPY